MKIKNFLPFEDVKYQTKLKETEVVNRLSQITEPKKTFRFGLSAGTKSYEGDIGGQSFNLQRIINYRNSFLPCIIGHIESDINGTIIKIRMRLHTFVIVFICVWSSIVGLGCLAVLVNSISKRTLHPAILIPFGMLIFLYILTMSAFKYESNKSKADFRKMFETEEVLE